MASGTIQSSTATSISSDAYPRHIKVVWNSVSNTANCNSVLSYTIKAGGTNSSNWVNEYGITVTINGTTVYSSSSGAKKLYSGQTLKSGSITIPHNTSTGTASVRIQISAKLTTSSVNSKYDGNITLDTIPRASSFGTISGNTIGSSITVNISRHSSAFTHQLWYKLGNSTWYDLGTGIGTSKTFSPVMDLCKQIPNATSGTLELCLRTYQGSTRIGNDIYKNITVNVPASAIPTLNSVTAAIDNSLNETVKNWGIAVAGYTKVKVAASAAGSNGSTIKSFSVSGGYSTQQNGTALSYTGGVITSSGSKTFTVKAKDSRGRSSASKTSSAITFYAYSKPQIVSFSAVRSTSNAQKMIVKADWSFASVNSKNTVTVKLEYKKSTASTWTVYSGTIQKNTSTTLTPVFDEKSSYHFRITITDALNEKATKEAPTVSTMLATMHFRAGGKGLAIGKMSEKDALEVAMPHYALNPFYPQGGIYPVVITSSTDLNTLITPGIYAANNSNLQNAPIETTGTLCSIEICRIGGASKCIQKITYAAGNGIRTYERYYTNETDSWYKWVCTADTRNQVLWSSTGLYMKEGQIITLSEPISQQANGIILTFAPYYVSPNETTSTAKPWDNIDVFVSKGTVNGHVKDFPLFALTFTHICIKKLGITDTQIIGNDTNTAKGTTNGVSWDNSKFVLTKVTGC